MWCGLPIMVALVGLQSPGTSEEGTNPAAYTHVRPMQTYLIGLVREGYARSATFRQLVDTIQRSNVTIFLRPGTCAGGRIRSCLVSVSGSEHARYIWIKIDPQHTIRAGLIATVGHELQHAVEIAEHPDVIDAFGAVRLYRTLGLGRCHEGLSEECETQAALDIEKAVINELLER